MQEKRRIVVVTGLSGAGKSSALRAFEDISYHAIDNLPLTMLNDLLKEASEKAVDTPLAIGIDSRTLHFSPDLFLSEMRALRKQDTIDLHVLFMDASTDVLMKRFSETRRRHPLESGKPLRQAIKEERQLMSELRLALDGIIDTSNRSSTDTRRVVVERFSDKAEKSMVITTTSFGFSKGVPRDVDLIFDVRFLRNPHYVPELKKMTGQDEAVANYVRADEGFAEFVSKVQDMVEFLLPRYEVEGKSYLTIAFGCTGGKHRSVMMAETMARLITKEGRKTNIYHRDIDAI
ncbi:RNase adapter RapZ [Kordiimonas sp. SCSIO 12610]|uniref:RNase adapter RapZ n=1 Tax=Kordiimonas sp. SCSIO 12610 TaxID=2829597 RepID=UPI0021088BF4|nr:RNase adapter RapZ [Kordiimonas sp. SCSIO 12610]UTW55231.1 RNase adapter RapZ [Kordiimonas sp. SCSIO 12610]